MARINVSYEVTLQTPLHIGTGEGFAGIIDKKTLSHKEDNKRFPVVFGHSVKGVVKEEFDKLLALAGHSIHSRESLFGTEEQQGSLFFSIWQLKPEFKTMLRSKTDMLFDVKSGNQIVRGRRVAKSEHLFTHEFLQNGLILEGTVSGTVSENPSLNGVPEPVVFLLLALQSVKHIGGRRRAGLGAISIDITGITIDNQSYTKKEIKQKLETSIEALVKEEGING